MPLVALVEPACMGPLLSLFPGHRFQHAIHLEAGDFQKHAFEPLRQCHFVWAVVL